MRKLLLIEPVLKEQMWMLKLAPYGLSILASLSPKHYSVEIKKTVRTKLNRIADIVGITSNVFTSKMAYKIADHYRKMNTKVVLGGIHASFFPEEAIEHADSVVMGEAEEIWPEVLEDFENGNLKRFYKMERYPALDKIPALDYAFLKKSGYLVNQIQTSRGCPHNCRFCCVTQYNGHNMRCRNIDDVIRELKAMNSKYIFFLDDNIIGNKAYARELFKALIPLKIFWASQCSLEIAKDDQLLESAVESGCRCLLIGFETLDPKSLRDVEKPFNPKQYVGLTEKLRKKNILVWGFFIYGFRDQNNDTFRETLAFCYEYVDISVFHLLSAVSSRLTSENYGETLGGTFFLPKAMSKEQLFSGAADSYRQFYSIPRILKRSKRFGLKYLPMLGLMNLLFRISGVLELKSIRKRC